MKKFGNTYVSKGINDLIESFGMNGQNGFARFVGECVKRFDAKDWGDNMTPPCKRAMTRAFNQDKEIKASYTYADTGNLFAIWIIREVGTYKRKTTTVILPEEF